MVVVATTVICMLYGITFLEPLVCAHAPLGFLHTGQSSRCHKIHTMMNGINSWFKHLEHTTDTAAPSKHMDIYPSQLQTCNLSRDMY